MVAERCEDFDLTKESDLVKKDNYYLTRIRY